jgi:hypothetical protein
MISCDCENCGQPTNGWFFIMIQRADGTWIERVNGSDPEPGDLYCCYDCSEQLESPMVFAIDDDRDAVTDVNVSIYLVYLLLKKGKVVYVGKSLAPENRVQRHWNVGYDFDEIIETLDGPYSESEALRQEKSLIWKYQPVYNVNHRTCSRIVAKMRRRAALITLQKRAAREEALDALEELQEVDL